MNDVTARDLQKTDGQWTRAKGFDTFCPVGPWVLEQFGGGSGGRTGADDEAERSELKQQGTTDEMVFDVATLVRYISRIMTLMPGDLIATGTPAGVGPMESRGCGGGGDPGAGSAKKSGGLGAGRPAARKTAKAPGHPRHGEDEEKTG